MTLFIIIVIVIIIAVAISQASRGAETEKVKNAMGERLKQGASPEEVLSEFVALSVQQLGRPLAANELDKLRGLIKENLAPQSEMPQQQIEPVSISPEERQVDLEAYMEKLAKGQVSIKVSLASVPIILKPREDAKFVIPGVVLREPRSIRTSKGYYGGPSIRVTKGVYFRVGKFSSSSQSHEELKTIDAGTLTVTDERIIFSGEKKTILIEFRKILSLDPFSDGIGIHKEGKERTQYFLWSEGLAKAEINTNGHTYKEPFTGLLLKNAVEGMIRNG